MQRRLFIDRRNAHQPVDLKTKFCAARVDEGRRIVRRHARLLRFLAGVDLYVQLRRGPVARINRGPERSRERRAIQRLNHVKERDRITRLIGLEGPNQVQLHVAVRSSPLRPARLGLLDPVFSKHAMPGGQERIHPVARLTFRHGHQRDILRFALDLARGLGNGL